MTIPTGTVLLSIVGLLGIINFIDDFRKKKINWWKCLLLVISILLIAQGLCACFFPDFLYRLYN